MVNQSITRKFLCDKCPLLFNLFVCFLGGTVGLNFLRSFLGFYPVYSPFSVSKCVVPNVFVLISISNDSHSYSISSGRSLQRKQVRPFSCEKKNLRVFFQGQKNYLNNFESLSTKIFTFCTQLHFFLPQLELFIFLLSIST